MHHGVYTSCHFVSTIIQLLHCMIGSTSRMRDRESYLCDASITLMTFTTNGTSCTFLCWTLCNHGNLSNTTYKLHMWHVTVQPLLYIGIHDV